MKYSKRMLALVLAFVLTFLQMSEISFAAEPTISGVTLSSDIVAALGEIVELEVSGTALTSENWGASVTAYIKGTDIERPTLKAQVKNITASGAEIVIPQNTMVNEIEYRVIAGVIKNGVQTKEVETVIVQKGKKATVSIDPKAVVQTGTTTIEVIFPEEILAETEEISKLKNLIYVSDFGNETSNRVELADDSTVTIVGNVATIDFKVPLELKVNSAITIKEGAFANSAGKVLKTVSWLITYVPTVTGILLDDDILDYQGGMVTATLTGIHVEQIKAKQIQANVFVPEVAAATDMPVEINVEDGKAPVLTFEVPENVTKTTKCYFLQVKIDGNPVYEATVENPAKKAVVSVLPKGEDETKQTLGAATITGNNKLEGVGDNSNITVMVSKQLGELKTVMTLYGTNLNSKLTKVRAIDENGIVWPVYNIPE